MTIKIEDIKLVIEWLSYESLRYFKSSLYDLFSKEITGKLLVELVNQYPYFYLELDGKDVGEYL